jgi:hypothetical protein
VGVSPLENAGRKAVTPAEAEQVAGRELVKAARARGDDLTGPDGLLKMITKTVARSTWTADYRATLTRRPMRAFLTQYPGQGIRVLGTAHPVAPSCRLRATMPFG